jgi:hypothetical protein
MLCSPGIVANIRGRSDEVMDSAEGLSVFGRSIVPRACYFAFNVLWMFDFD